MNAAGGITASAYAGAFAAGKAGGPGTVTSTAHTPEEKELLRQLSDPNSSFYVQMRQALLQKGKKKKADDEEQDRIEAMLLMLDALNGRVDKKDLQKMTAITKLGGVDRERELPWSIQVFLMGLTGGEDLRPEEEKDQVEQISGNSPDSLPSDTFYDTIYRSGSAPEGDEAAAGIQPDMTARAALRWMTGEEQI